MLLKGQTVKKITDIDHLSSLKSFTLLHREYDPNIDYFEPENIDYIKQALEREKIGDRFKLYQAFYNISDGFPDVSINISVLISPELNIAFISTTTRTTQEDYGNVEQLLAGLNYRQDAGSYPSYIRVPPLSPVNIPLEALRKKWINFIKLDDRQVAEFLEAMSQIKLQTMRCIAFNGFIEYIPLQEGRVIEAPDIVYRFCSYAPHVDLASSSKKHYFRYFMFLLLFFQRHSRNKLAHNVINTILAHYRR
jgi:hypothetical protein